MTRRCEYSSINEFGRLICTVDESKDSQLCIFQRYCTKACEWQNSTAFSTCERRRNMSKKQNNSNKIENEQVESSRAKVFIENEQDVLNIKEDYIEAENIPNFNSIETVEEKEEGKVEEKINDVEKQEVKEEIKKEKKEVKRILDMLGILTLEKKVFSKLSGGQKQRVLLARALCACGGLLVLDEPVAGLDPEATEEMYATVERLNREHNISVIMITHDMNAVKKYAKQVLKIGE